MAQPSPVVESLLRIHKVISRALRVAIGACDGYLGTRGLPPEEADGFRMYVTTLKWMTHSHHLTENELAFPYFRNELEAPYSRLATDH